MWFMNTRYVRELEKYIGMIGPRNGGESKLPLSCRIDGCSREVFTCYAPAIFIACFLLWTHTPRTDAIW